MQPETTADDLLTVAAELRKQREAVGDPLAATSEREKMEKAEQVRLLETNYHLLERTARQVQQAAAELADLHSWRDKLAAASDTLRQRLETELDTLADLTPPDTGPVEHKVQELEQALRCLDHYHCAACAGLFREGELEQQVDEDGYTFLVCSCGSDALTAPALRDSFGSTAAPPVLRDLIPAVDWAGAKSWSRTLRIIRLTEEKRDKALKRVRHLIEDDAVEVAA